MANFNGGNVVVYPIGNKGALGTGSDNVSLDKTDAGQATAHAHSITASPSGRYLLACDLGLDKIIIHRLDRQVGKLMPHGDFSASKGSSPRHVSFHPSGKFVYLIHQYAGTITAFGWDDELGLLSELQTVATVPADFKADPAASEIQVHPNGRWLYASNRGHNSLVIFGIDLIRGLLSLVGFQPGLGVTPRNFALTASGELLLEGNQDSDQVVVFKLDPESGLLTELNRQAVPTPAASSAALFEPSVTRLTCPVPRTWAGRRSAQA